MQKYRLRISTCLLLLLISGTQIRAAARPLAAGEGAQGMRVLRSDETGMVLAVDTPLYSLSSALEAGATFDRLAVPGADLTAQPGEPELPVFRALIGVPPGAQVEIRLLTDQVVSLPGRYTLPPAPQRGGPGRVLLLLRAWWWHPSILWASGSTGWPYSSARDVILRWALDIPPGDLRDVVVWARGCRFPYGDGSGSS